LKPNQAMHLLELHYLGAYSTAELAELFGVGRSTIYRTLERLRAALQKPERPFAHPTIQKTTDLASALAEICSVQERSAACR